MNADFALLLLLCSAIVSILLKTVNEVSVMPVKCNILFNYSGTLVRRLRVPNFYKQLSFLALALIINTVSFSQCLKDLTDTQPITVTTCGNSGLNLSSKAFDNADDAFTGWKVNHNPEPGNECWIMVKFTGASQVVRGYSITSFDDRSGNTNIAPSDWQLQGSNDGITWTTLDTKAAQSFAIGGETHVHTITNTLSYVYYRFFISQTSLTSSSILGIAEIQLFESVCITGTVFRDGGDRASAYNPLSDFPMSGIPVKIVTSPTGNVVASTTTNTAGRYTFPAASIPAIGSFTVIMTPPASNIFVTQPTNIWSTWVSLPSPEEEPPAGAVFFDYHVSSSTGKKAAMNRMRFPGGNLDFGLAAANPPPGFRCTEGSLTNLITEGNNGNFGNSSYIWEKAHPWQKAFLGASNILYSSIPASATSYGFSNVP
ncbi:MAG: discoidin domain-containing protein, partial [Ginsengibacter sp.]